jgi:hypothetical protein
MAITFKTHGHFFKNLLRKQKTRYVSQELLFVFENKAKNVQEMSERDNLLLGSGNCMCEKQKQTPCNVNS